VLLIGEAVDLSDDEVAIPVKRLVQSIAYETEDAHSWYPAVSLAGSRRIGGLVAPHHVFTSDNHEE
jgi:hypothetical protein